MKTWNFFEQEKFLLMYIYLFSHTFTLAKFLPAKDSRDVERVTLGFEVKLSLNFRLVRTKEEKEKWKKELGTIFLTSLRF